MKEKIVHKLSHLLKFRPGKYADFCVLAQRTEREYGWGMSEKDYHLYNKFLGHDWFWVADNEKDKTVGYFSAAQRTPDYGHLGMVYVREDYRDGGIGSVITDKAMQLLKGNIGLVSTPKAIPLYESHGFTKSPDFTVGIAKGSISRNVLKENVTPKGVIFHELTYELLKPLVAYDSQIWSRDRSGWCTDYILNQLHSTTMVALDPSKNTIYGYGSIKVIDGKRLKICPLYADSPDIAETIMLSLLNLHEDDLDKYEVEVWNMQSKDQEVKGANTLTSTLGLESKLLGKHMFTTEVPKIAKEKIFAFADTDVPLG